MFQDIRATHKYSSTASVHTGTYFVSVSLPFAQTGSVNPAGQTLDVKK